MYTLWITDTTNALNAAVSQCVMERMRNMEAPLLTVSPDAAHRMAHHWLHGRDTCTDTNPLEEREAAYGATLIERDWSQNTVQAG